MSGFSDYSEKMSALLQLHLHSQPNTWLQWIGQRQQHDETRNIYVLGLGAFYIRELTVYYINNMVPRGNWCDDDNMCCLGYATSRQSAIEYVWIIWSHTIYYLLVRWLLWIPFMTNKHSYYIVRTTKAYVSKPKQPTGIWNLFQWRIKSKLTKLSCDTIVTYCCIHKSTKVETGKYHQCQTVSVWWLWLLSMIK